MSYWNLDLLIYLQLPSDSRAPVNKPAVVRAFADHLGLSSSGAAVCASYVKPRLFVLYT